MDRRLCASRRRAASLVRGEGRSSLDELLASMGSQRAAAALAERHTPPPSYTPQTASVGEAVWDPSVPTHSPRDLRAADAPSLATELARAHALRRLQAGVEAELLQHVGPAVLRRLEVKSSQTLRNGNGLVDRWLAQRRLAARDGTTPRADPLLPLPHACAAEVPELIEELQRGGASAESAEAAANGMGRVASEALEEFLRRCRKLPPPGSPVLMDRDGCETVEVRCGKVAHSINRPHCLKLLELYRRSTGCEVGMREPKFVAALFTVLTRYEALGGAGMQAALNGGVFEVLKCRFGVTSECFASPFNCRWSSYCSAFPDTDALFGSMGDFFSVFGGPQVIEGSFEANPPFIPAVIGEMGRTMNSALKAADHAGVALSFVVVVPSWSEDKADRFASLANSAYLRRQLVAHHREHHYFEGAQHQRRVGKMRRATCDTAIYILQTASAAQRWSASDDSCHVLLGALSEGRACISSASGGACAPNADDTESSSVQAIARSVNGNVCIGTQVTKKQNVRRRTVQGRPSAAEQQIRKRSVGTRGHGAHILLLRHPLAGMRRRAQLAVWPLLPPQMKLLHYKHRHNHASSSHHNGDGD
ncbi:hypothetical protein AB1Y20_012968 [Prymnesium parvum]|uniref:PCIF1 WW domain-containing protein n=1 Tax=Prymnesium parvum TaxID=97485 RepID=A0AB34IKU3_PRYPA